MNRRSVKRLLAIVLAASMLQAVLLIYTGVGKTAVDKVKKQVQAFMGKQPNQKNTAEKQSPDDAVKIKKSDKKQIDTSGIILDQEVEKDIKTLDPKNSDKNIKNYKKLLSEFKVDKKLRKEIEKHMKKGNKAPDIFTAYDFLSENYGQIGELEELLNKRKSGAEWADIFKEYNQKHPEFKPRNFEAGYLEKLMKDTSLTPDDIMIADRVSQKALKTFEELIAMRKDGKTWSEINSGLGIVNTQEKLPRVAASSVQVKKYAKDTKLTEEQVLNALVIAQKMEKDENEIIEKVKAGKKKEEIYTQCYDEKYR